MSSTLTSPRRRPLSLLLTVLAVVTAACGTNSPDPETRLNSAVENTFDGAFSYTLTVDADRAALEAMGDGAGDAATFLQTFGFSGVVDGEDGRSFAIDLGGNAPLLELRTFSDEAFYVNVGLNDFLSLAGAGAFDPRDELAPALDALGFEDEVKAAVLDALDGKWVGVEGELDVARLQALMGADAPTVDEEEASEAAAELFGDDAAGFFERYVTIVETVAEDDTERFEVAFELRELMRAMGELNQRVGAEGSDALTDVEADLQDLPETVPGTVIVDEGHVTLIRLDVADTARQAGAELEGAIVLQVAFADFDDVEPLSRPEGATVLTDEQFTDAMAKLIGLTGGL
ncbi:MAG: hypothetical protein KY461_04145 [Actinobacteria bacterium]|nr:hypothetical protein [Actinomycetota bacterium]